LRLNRKIAVDTGDLSTVEVGGIRGVAVKCLDITKNSDCEGSLLELQLTLMLESVGIKQD
jgi:hypothetical protein